MTSSTRLTIVAAMAVALASLALGGVFAEGGWILPVLGAIAVVAACGELGRRLGLPLLVQPLLSLLGLLCWLTLVFAMAEAPLIVVPGKAALERLVELAQLGFDDIARYASPISTYESVVLLAVAGLGLVAILVDFIAVGLRRPAVAGLPLLAIYCVPASVANDGVGWAAFLLGGAGWLALLLTDSRERVGRWGRPVGFRADDRHTRGYVGEIETSLLAALGRRIGFTALGLAVVVPAVLPTIDLSTLGFGPGGFGFGRGGNTVTVVNPIVSLQRDLNRPDNVEVLRYRTEDRTLDYLRLATLDTFNGTSWEAAELTLPPSNRLDQPLPAPPGLADIVDRERQTMQVEVRSTLNGQWMPAPYPPLEVQVEGDWRYDLETFNLFAPRGNIRNIDYQVSYLDIDPSTELLRAGAVAPSSFDRYLALPELPPVIAETALAVTANASTSFDKARAIENWLTSDEFSYSTTVRSGNSASALVEFLQDKVGYCEQYAATMAVFARVIGIPTRVNTGFTPGTQLPDGSWSVTSHDAHAWPELYFPGAGWLRFEPTPTGDGRTTDAAWMLAAAAEELPDAATPTPGASAAPAPGQTPPPNIREAEEGVTDGGGTAGSRWDIPVTAVLIVLGVLALLAVPAMVRLVVRRRRWRTAGKPRHAAAAWAELRDSAVDLGYEWRSSETPRQVAARLGDEAELAADDAGALTSVARVVERARYARDPGEPVDLTEEITAVRTGLAAPLSRWRRWRAVLLPRSTRSVVTALSERVADALDWLDQLGARLRQRVIPRRSN